ncbi:MAG: hypothetical protein QOC92_2136 [Acidimicrobiaceae bacterium]|jgi:hypothetical protein
MRRWPLYALIAWTVFVWAGRIRNGGSVVLAASFLVLAALAVWRRGRWVTALAAWTVGVWAIRTPFILANDHPVGFKVVHTMLAAVSIGLAVSAERHIQRQRQTATTAARL